MPVRKIEAFLHPSNWQFQTKSQMPFDIQLSLEYVNINFVFSVENETHKNTFVKLFVIDFILIYVHYSIHAIK